MKNKNEITAFSVSVLALFLFSTFSPPVLALTHTTTTANATDTPILFDANATSTATTTEPLQPAEATSTPPLPTLAESEAMVRSVFVNDPLMIKIAKCESGFRQFNDDGKVLTSRNGLYIGVFQIDPKIHADYAKSLGHDIFTLQGNLEYAKILRNSSGYKPWPACAQKAIGLTQNLSVGMANSQIKTLQQILNSAGFIVAKTGPGSAGDETTYFGPATKNAVKKFQCAKKIVCSGSESTTGYGLVGKKTRAALIAAALK